VKLLNEALSWRAMGVVEHIGIKTSRLRKLGNIPGMLREAVEAQKLVRFERSHFKSYGESSLVFEVAYHVLSADHGVYMDIQQAINIQIFWRFAKEDIRFAYPTRTLNFRNTASSTESVRLVFAGDLI